MENLDAQLRKLLVATESLVFYRKALTGHTYMVSKSLGKDTNQTSVADPGSGAFLAPGSGMNISERLETNFWVKMLKFFDADPGSGMEKIRIRDLGRKKLGSGINIPDPQHGYKHSL